MQKIDVIMLTKNSIKPCLKETIESVIREIAINKLIVVDGGSTDDTLDLLSIICSKEGVNLSIIDDRNGTRATSRQLGIQKMETDFFAFVDSDVILPSNWFGQIMRHLEDEKVGAVWGASVECGAYQRYRDAMSKLYKLSVFELARRQGVIRGLLHDTVIRKETIEGIKIPRALHVLEDEYIRRYIEKKGYRWLATSNPYCKHYRGFHRPIDGYLEAYYSKRIGLYSKKWFLKHSFLWLPKLLYLSLFVKDPNFLKSEFLKEIYFTVGYLK